MYFLNVHGYQGHSGNNVFQMLKACFPEVEIISPQLVNKPSILMGDLEFLEFQVHILLIKSY